MRDEILLGALAIGGLWLMGSLKKNGKTVGTALGESLGEGAAQGAIDIIGGTVYGGIKTAVTQEPKGPFKWDVPIPGGHMSGDPIDVLLAGPIAWWNLLPGLPDIY